MQLDVPREVAGRRRLAGACCAAVCTALILGGCASGITTPLPELPRSNVSTAMSPQERQRAVDELNRAGATHEQDAERQIESSR